MIAVVVTVLNEVASIDRLLASLAMQTRRPDRVVIVDGGSRDGTPDRIRAWATDLPITLIDAPGANISEGRNCAIRAVSADDDPIIAVTDAGVTLVADWLECITQPLIDDPSLEVVGGFFYTEAQTIFEAALGATTLPLSDEIRPDSFLPSSRSIAFRRRAWTLAGGYPEWLDYCEDLIFDLRLKARGTPIAFEPRAVVGFRPRRTIRAFFTQYYRYARGDGKADLWRTRHAVRYGVYLIGAPLIAALGWRVSRAFWLLFLVGGWVYVRRPYRRLRTVLDDGVRANAVRVTLGSNLWAIALVPILRVVGDVAKMVGYPVGWLWRLRHRPPDWR